MTACKVDSHNISTYDTPQAVVKIPDDFRRYEGLPLDLTKILVALKFDAPPYDPNAIGYPQEQKIKYFDVSAYVEYGDGWLIASGYGEWGGIVFWIDKKGHYEIIRHDDLAYPIDLIADGDKLFLIQGMLHLSLEDGHLLEIVRENGIFSTYVHPINGYPTGFKQESEGWIIPIGSKNGYYVLSELRAGKNIHHPYK